MTTSRDWTEDASEENGNYQNACVECQEMFTGLKRRVVCKACHEKHIDESVERMAFWNQMQEDEYIEEDDDQPEFKQHIKDTNLLLSELKRVRQQLAEFTVKEGPLNAECWTLGHLMEMLEKWKAIASDKTCISVENLCYGASSLWHQTHRENFRKVNAKPESLSQWVLMNEGSVRDDFATQVLEILEKLKEERKSE